MAEQPPPAPAPSPADVQAGLHAVARILRGAHPLAPQAQQALADVVDELADTLTTAAAPSAQITHLADSAAQFVQAVHQHRDKGRLASARERLEQAILAAEAQAPFAAGLAQRLLDALANLGI